jgi:transcriptional regulator with XRE-family HTH domain
MATATQTKRRPADDLRRTFADNLRAARVTAGMTQTHLAIETGWSQNWISQLENGKRKADIDEIATLADVLGVTPAELLTPAA